VFKLNVCSAFLLVFVVVVAGCHLGDDLFGEVDAREVGVGVVEEVLAERGVAAADQQDLGGGG
jgi:hypothetical protein